MNKDPLLYAASISDSRRPLFDKLQSLIFSLYPDATLSITYGVLKHQVKTGQVWLGFWKDGVSIYTGVPPVIAEFKAKYPHIKTGKGSINFKVTDKIPLTALKKVIKAAMEQKKNKPR